MSFKLMNFNVRKRQDSTSRVPNYESVPGPKIQKDSTTWNKFHAYQSSKINSDEIKQVSHSSVNTSNVNVSFKKFPIYRSNEISQQSEPTEMYQERPESFLRILNSASVQSFWTTALVKYRDWIITCAILCILTTTFILIGNFMAIMELQSKCDIISRQLEDLKQFVENHLAPEKGATNCTEDQACTDEDWYLQWLKHFLG